MNKLAVAVLITAIIAISVSLDCSRVVYKEQEGLLNWLGRINITVPVSTGPAGWTMTLYFDHNFTGVGVWEGFVTSNGTAKWAEIRNRNESDAQLEAGKNKNLTFRINYDRQIPARDIPQVVGLRFQDIEMCI